MAKRATNRKPAADAPTPRRLEAVPGAAPARESLALDRVIHERVRLAIVSALAVNDTLSFNDLKRLTGATDGNLSVHARKLEEAGYLTYRKSFEGRMPKTEYQLTQAGRAALERYVGHMEALIAGMRGEGRGGTRSE